MRNLDEEFLNTGKTYRDIIKEFEKLRDEYQKEGDKQGVKFMNDIINEIKAGVAEHIVGAYYSWIIKRTKVIGENGVELSI